MKTIYITELQRNKINDLLLENEGTNMKRARKYLESKGYSPEQRQQILDSIRTDIPNTRLNQCKFLLGVTRLYMEGQLNDGNAIANLNKTLKYIASDAHVNEYDFNLNGENLNTLVQRFADVAESDLELSRNASNARQLTVNDNYAIVPIDTPEEAAKYGKYTSWCVTHDENMYNSYTNNGSGRFYFCLRKGFENEPEVEGEGCPLDSYGLSMIAVSVTMEGEVNTITCRWNHDNSGNDNIMTIEELEDLIGRNFYQTFKPYTREELNAKCVILFNEVQELLDSRKKPEEIFDYCHDFYEGFATAVLNDKWNFINVEGKLLSSQWFDYCNDFKEGFAAVELNGKWNFINVKGKLLLSQWFDDCNDFKEGFAAVELNNKWNFINVEGKLLSSQWFDGCLYFSEGFVVVRLNDKWNFINVEGKLLSPQWFDVCNSFREGFARVRLNNKWNYINVEGKLLSPQWFDWCGNFYEGFARVRLNDKYFSIDKDGRLYGEYGRPLSESKKSRKTIYITEAQRKLLKENILLDKVPEDITNAILRGKTSLKNNPAIPNVFENSYLEIIIKKRFKETVNELKKIGEINDVPETDIPTVLNKLILKCQELEKPYRSELEKLCYNYVIGLFDVPDDTITVDFRLVDEVDLNKSSIKLDPIHDDSDEIEYEDIKQFSTISDEVYKRRMLNVLAMGAGLQVSSNIKSYLSNIYDINPKLPDLYRKIIALNNYLLLTKETLGMNEDNKMQIGTVEIILGNEDDKVKIDAQGKIFPVLLSECVRGFMELFASHGLPKNREILDIVLAKSDYLKAEPWDMRIGPSLWTILSENFEGIDFKTVPYLFKKISCLSCKNFNKFMQEVLAKTKTGKRLMGKLIEKAKTEKEYNKFSDKMSKLQTDKNIITDEYIHPEEL